MPAPMTAPMPSVTKLMGPRARFRLCSPVSEASFNSVSSGLVANSGLPMQTLLRVATGRSSMLESKLDASIVGASLSRPYGKILLVRAVCPSSAARPEPINGHADEHDNQTH